MILNEKYLKILKAIDEEKSLSEIASNLGYPIQDYLDILEKHEYCKIIRLRWGSSVSLTPKGRIALHSPEDLIETPNYPMNNNHINISGSINAPIGFFQQSNNNIVSFNQGIDEQRITEILQSIQSLYQSIEEFPEEQKEIAIVNLHNLQEEIQEPQRRNIKKIKVYLVTLLGIAATLGTCVANTTDFVNNLTDVADKFNIELPLSQFK
ncbi:hypothetical protein PCC7424_1295 [Gloeothece citriformis PCC 7424]|uniref:Uncharacterized protein n=1 Tax=Gloeothece citriformis (strain PCC 7424) TaxID=65393 RepID=B7K7H4_GLOC7|nr:hypothetical protein [Gloeothece citriformis]ACK69742.1 hypothetical protein PCC7424_1295 [Gloeothece citriformis PCC 7424]